MKYILLILSFSAIIHAQLRDQGQRTDPAIGSVTSRAFHGSGAPGAIAGSLSQDTYLDNSVSPSVPYICAALPGASCSSVAPGQWQAFVAAVSGAPCPQYDVVCNYHASGSAATTLGTIAANSDSLSVFNNATFAVGEGIYVPGCIAASGQNPGGNLITSIAAISGNTFTLAASCTVAVTGVTVMHDDCAAINSALSSAFNSGVGGTIFLRRTGVDGEYRCSAVADPATGGELTLPQALNAAAAPVPIAIVGEAAYAGLDFSNAPNVSGNSAFSAAPYAVATSQSQSLHLFEPVDLIMDNVAMTLPAQSKLNGLMLANALQAHIGDHTIVSPQPDIVSPCCTWNQPTGNSTGIWMPQAYNDVLLSVGGKIAFWSRCLVPGEHGVMTHPYLYGCLDGAIYLYSYNHDVEGAARVESSPIMIAVDASASSDVPAHFHVDGEGWGTGWLSRVQDVKDPNNRLVGDISYWLYGPGAGSNGATYMTRGGGALNVAFHNTGDIALYGASGFQIYPCNTDTQNYKETVYDALSPTYLGIYNPGSGGTIAPVVCNGVNWVTY